MILAQQSSSGGGITLILFLALPVVLFLMMRSQRDRRTRSNIASAIRWRPLGLGSC